MVLPLLKLGTLALKTLSKPIVARLKKEAGIHPKFRNFIVSIAQVFDLIPRTIMYLFINDKSLKRGWLFGVFFPFFVHLLLGFLSLLPIYCSAKTLCSHSRGCLVLL